MIGQLRKIDTLARLGANNAYEGGTGFLPSAMANLRNIYSGRWDFRRKWPERLLMRKQSHPR